MSNENTDDINIEQLYQSAANELPSKETDSQILDFARTYLPKSGKQPAPSRNWRRWQWPASVAASVMLVAVLYIHSQHFVLTDTNPSTDSLEVFVNDDAEIQRAAAREQARMREVKMETPKVELGGASISMTDQGSSLERTSLLKSADMLEHSTESNELASADYLEAATSLVEEIRINQQDSMANVLRENEELDSIRVTGTRDHKAFDAELDIEYLDRLIAVINSEKSDKQSELSRNDKGALKGVASFAEISPKEQDAEIPMSKEEAEQALHRYLEQWQNAHPDKTLPQQYVPYLKKAPEPSQ